MWEPYGKHNWFITFLTQALNLTHAIVTGVLCTHGVSHTPFPFSGPHTFNPKHWHTKPHCLAICCCLWSSSSLCDMHGLVLFEEPLKFDHNSVLTILHSDGSDHWWPSHGRNLFSSMVPNCNYPTIISPMRTGVRMTRPTYRQIQFDINFVSHRKTYICLQKNTSACATLLTPKMDWTSKEYSSIQDIDMVDALFVKTKKW